MNLPSKICLHEKIKIQLQYVKKLFIINNNIAHKKHFTINRLCTVFYTNIV